jgi:hypothetical protein
MGSMFTGRTSHMGEHLPQRNPSVIRRNALVPVRSEAFLGETSDRSLGQVLILKAPTRQHNTLFSATSGYLNNDLTQCVVELE